MTYAATLTRTGQITVPKWVRELLGVESGQRIVFRKEKNAVLMEREKTAEETADEIHALIPDDVREAYIKDYGGLTAREVQEKWIASDAAEEYFAEEIRRSL